MKMEQNMPCWYYEKAEILNTPSFLDGVETEVEDRYRSEGARFIFNLGTKLHLRYDTCATAIVFFHRFYMLHSFKSFPKHVTAACCLMLAGKVEETPKKCRDIIRTARVLLADNLFEQFGSDPREEIMVYERVLLKTIKFDLQVSHPYRFLLQFAKRIKGDAEKIKQLVQMAWSFINDSLATTLCLQWEPEIVACAVLYLATRMKKCQIDDWERRQPGQRWWECFVEGMTTDVMEDICHKILDIYHSSNSTEHRQQSEGNLLEKSTPSGLHRRQAQLRTGSISQPMKRQRTTSSQDPDPCASNKKSLLENQNYSRFCIDNKAGTSIPLYQGRQSRDNLPPPPPPACAPVAYGYQTTLSLSSLPNKSNEHTASLMSTGFSSKNSSNIPFSSSSLF